MELIFEKSQLDLLKELQSNTSDRYTYQKFTTLIMIHNKFSSFIIAENLGITPSTVNRHYNQYQSVKDFDKYIETHYKPCVGKLSEEQKVLVKTYVQSSICHSSLKVLNYIKSTFDIEYKPDSVIALLHRLGRFAAAICL